MMSEDNEKIGKHMQKKIAHEEALFYEEMLRKEINADKAEHNKKPLKDKNDNNGPGAGGGSDKFEDYTGDEEDGMKNC